jgi:hypothetical protein
MALRWRRWESLLVDVITAMFQIGKVNLWLYFILILIFISIPSNDNLLLNHVLRESSKMAFLSLVFTNFPISVARFAESTPLLAPYALCSIILPLSNLDQLLSALTQGAQQDIVICYSISEVAGLVRRALLILLTDEHTIRFTTRK